MRVRVELVYEYETFSDEQFEDVEFAWQDAPIDMADAYVPSLRDVKVEKVND